MFCKFSPGCLKKQVLFLSSFLSLSFFKYWGLNQESHILGKHYAIKLHPRILLFGDQSHQLPRLALNSFCVVGKSFPSLRGKAYSTCKVLTAKLVDLVLENLALKGHKMALPGVPGAPLLSGYHSKKGALKVLKPPSKVHPRRLLP